MVEVAPGVRRVTFPLPLGIDHVHCYLLRGDDGWTLVDTGLGLPSIVEEWRRIVASLDGPVARIVITHMHPDHVGAAADVVELTGARVLQGPLDHEQCVRAWGAGRNTSRWWRHLREHGTPDEVVEKIAADSAWLARHVHTVDDTGPIDEGDRVGEWTVLALPGHADGHLALLSDDGILVAGDTILAGITPTVGLWPDSRPDPLGDYLVSLARIASIAPRVALTGHHATVDDPPARAHEIVLHHEERLDLALATLADGPRSAYDVSLALFPGTLPPPQRRFALAEALSHLERLAFDGAATRVDGGYAKA